MGAPGWLPGTWNNPGLGRAHLFVGLSIRPPTQIFSSVLQCIFSKHQLYARPPGGEWV